VDPARVPSDTAKFPLRFNGGFWGCFVRTGVESIQPPKPFQAEYEGSIPFTRSNVFNGLEADFKMQAHLALRWGNALGNKK